MLRLGLTWPVDAAAVRRLADGVDEVVVMEERAGSPGGPGAARAGGPPPGRVGQGLPGRARGGSRRRRAWTRTSPSRRSRRLVLAAPGAFPAAAADRARAAEERARGLAARALAVTPRTPTYCAGCPHRGTNSPMLEIRKRLGDPDYMRRVHGRGAGGRDRPRRHRLLLDGLPAAVQGDARPVGDGPRRRDRRGRRARSSPTSTTCWWATARSSTGRCPRSPTRSSSARTSST